VLDALAERLGPQALAALDRSGQLLWASPRAQALLQGALPEAVVAAAWRLGALGRSFTLHLREQALEVEVSSAARGEVVLLAIESAGPPGAALAETARRFHLTPAEADTVALAARGLRNRQIAARLQIALPTVKTHLSRAFSKMGVQTRTQAALVARRLG
jgi:DNA-binding CsgD family transcriptional regulator